MSTTAQEIFYDVRALLDEYSDQGVLIPDADVADLQLKSIRFINMAQKELHKIGKIFKTFSYTNVPYANALGLLSNFDIVEHMGADDIYPVAGVAANAYYFEVDAPCTVYVQEFQGGAWSNLITITDTTATSMTAYKGVITPTTPGNLVRLKFTGQYYYKHQNRCLFTAPFSAGRVPDYRPWIKITLPSDLGTINSIVDEFPDRQYAKDVDYKQEGKDTLYINYYYNGTIRVVYNPVPTTITTITDTLQVDDITAKAISYYVAARLAPFENQNLVNFFEGKYIELKISAQSAVPLGWEQIKPAYTIGGGY